MRFSSRTRAAAVAAAIAALFPLVLSAPASAGELGAGDAAPSTCTTLVQGPTPSVEADTDGDGQADYRVPSFRNVAVCVGADVVLTQVPTVETEPCAFWATCMAFHFTVGLSGYADTDVLFCYTVDLYETCGTTTIEPIPLNVLDTRRMCVGYDLRGGSPCSNDQLIAFE